ncbi:MAG: hypothetical protein QW379_08100 [Thermoplasmata archaeon]
MEAEGEEADRFAGRRRRERRVCVEAEDGADRFARRRVGEDGYGDAEGKVHGRVEREADEDVEVMGESGVQEIADGKAELESAWPAGASGGSSGPARATANIIFQQM